MAIAELANRVEQNPRNTLTQRTLISEIKFNITAAKPGEPDKKPTRRSKPNIVPGLPERTPVAPQVPVPAEPLIAPKEPVPVHK